MSDDKTQALSEAEAALAFLRKGPASDENEATRSKNVYLDRLARWLDRPVRWAEHEGELAVVAVMVFGSNLAVPAWGRILLRSETGPKLPCRYWLFGVLTAVVALLAFGLWTCTVRRGMDRMKGSEPSTEPSISLVERWQSDWKKAIRYTVGGTMWGQILISLLILGLTPLALVALDESVMASASPVSSFSHWRFWPIILWMVASYVFIRYFPLNMYGAMSNPRETNKQRKWLVMFLSPGTEGGNCQLIDGLEGCLGKEPNFYGYEKNKDNVPDFIEASPFVQNLRGIRARLNVLGKEKRLGIILIPSPKSNNAQTLDCFRTVLHLVFSDGNTAADRKKSALPFDVSVLHYKNNGKPSCQIRTLDCQIKKLTGSTLQSGCDYEEVKDLQFVFNWLREDYKEDEKAAIPLIVDADLVIDCTSGLKINSAVAMIHAFGRETLVQYVQTNYPYKAKPYDINPAPKPQGI